LIGQQSAKLMFARSKLSRMEPMTYDSKSRSGTIRVNPFGHEYISALAHSGAGSGSLWLPGLCLLVIMNSFLTPFLACGGGGIPTVVFAVYGAGILSIAFFLVGVVCLFTRLRSFGVWLVSFSVLFAGGILWRLGIFG
jgi:hypothetical protein